ncbi:CPBP family intramembrane glutamic endopeptidase [Rhodanobacter sp. DHG33]|uniref:CPBP family intramembrane glutamic endopeptidase n=1 Tax=Rhodanobacter sp. DHG33 TaxID=2775921 RepID=UPI0017850BBF|nr:CPBP family intramembrane glutamic endopeptidase [Rhodanobacter sp. DHG33]MBD8897878.1 CPBP family intramembrane metalloprotease [Rhodanobacter sp. DHG33]
MQTTITGFRAIDRRTWLVTLGGLLLALGVVSLPFSDWDHEFAGIGHLLGNEAIWWIYIAAMLLYVRKVERRPLSSIGFRPPGVGNTLIGVAAGVAVLAMLGAMYFVILPALHLSDSVGSSANGGALMATPFWWRFISTVRAAVSEEVLFRGYAMQRIEEVSGSRTVALLLSLTVFTIDHVAYWGWSHELIVATGGLAFSLLYLWRRNLWVNIIAHFIVDAASVLA